MTHKAIFLFFSLLFVYSLSFATDLYVRDGGTSSSCTSWTDACDQLATAVGIVARGSTIWVADGTYTGTTFNVANSGATLITIKKATASAHGTETGWDAAYGDGQATFTGQLSFTSSYWVFDGVTGSMTTTATDYGFSLGTSQSAPTVAGIAQGATVSNITLSHIYAKATASDVEKLFFQNPFQSGEVNNITVSHSLLDGWQNGMMARGQGVDQTGWVFEYNMALNGFSSASNHGEWINPNSAGMINTAIRYNVFRGNSGGDGLTGVVVANNSDHTGAKIYGNIFDNVLCGNGIITGTSGGQMINAVVYNNTFLNMPAENGNAVGGTGQGSGNVAYNNFLYNMDAQEGGSFTLDYNAYFDTTNAPAETHRQVGSGNPFVNSSGGNYRLLAATNAGTTLASPYNVDPDGTTRGGDGVWDRGSFEYSGSDTTPSPFTFTDQTNVALGSTGNSDNVTLAGFDNTTTISISGDASCKYSINGAAFTAASGNVTVGDNVALQNVASGAYNTAVSCVPNIGGVTDTWTRTTLAASNDPVAARFQGAMMGRMQ